MRAIVWTVLPQERRDARMQRQAEFINRFRSMIMISKRIQQTLHESR